MDGLTDSGAVQPATVAAPTVPPSFEDRVSAAVRAYLKGKDLSRVSHQQAYAELFPEQVFPGQFEQIFRDVVNLIVSPPA